MRIVLLGAAGFIGTNLTIELAKNLKNDITVIDKNDIFFNNIRRYSFQNVRFIESKLDCDTVYEELLKNQDIVYHLMSTTVPTTSNQHISEELQANVVLSAKIFEACIKENIRRVIFISSGGTVYGKGLNCPLNESMPTNPISSYGIQKVTIEKLLYLYRHIYGLDFRIVRLSNPYGPYQRPNGVLGAVSTFTYKALKGETIEVYGDGSVIRDFIYIDDAIKGIIKISDDDCLHHKYNLGSGVGTSIHDVLKMIENTLNIKLDVIFSESRNVDVPVNFLDISRYEKEFGMLNPISLSDGIIKTAEFMKKQYRL